MTTMEVMCGPVAHAQLWVAAVPLPTLVAANPLQRQMPLAFHGGCDGQARQKVHRILCYGDSMTAGFCCGGRHFEPYARATAAQLGFAAGVPCEVSACGLNGLRADTMAQGLEAGLVDIAGFSGKGLSRVLRENGPFDLVVIMAGTNDMCCCRAAPDIEESLRCLHRACHECGVPTLALAPPPSPLRGDAWEAFRLPVLEALQRMEADEEGLLGCVDTAELVDVACTELWDVDGLHFSPLGSRTFGRRLADLLSSRYLPELPPPSAHVLEAARPEGRREADAPWSTPAQWPPAAAAAAWSAAVPICGWILVQA